MSSDPKNVLRERVSGSTIWLGILLKVNRWLLAGSVLLAAFVALVALSHAGLTPLRTIVESQDGLEFLFSAFIGAIITGTTIVVTINQLVLSQELGAVGDQRERMAASMEFRQDIEDVVGRDISPPEPAAFLYELVDAIQQQATRLDETIATERDEELQAAIEEYVESIDGNAEQVKSNLEDAQFGTFDVVWSALNFNYSAKIYNGRRLRLEYADELSEEPTDAIDELLELLKFFGPTREHFKTLYFQWELINLSRQLLYIAVPALVVMATMIMYVDADALPGTTLGVDNLVWLTSGGFVVGIAPFVVFIVYVLRIATVAKHTLAMGPFILRESAREEDLGD